MKIAHFSDTHLGFSDYTKVDPVLGINLREADVYRAFSQVIDYIVKNPPDILIHSGDLFDNNRPSNRAINIALKEIAGISRKKIPFVLISGNHSTPRIKSSGSIFESFEIFENVYPVYKSKYEEIVIKDTALHCVPHMSTEQELNKVFQDIKLNSKAKYNIIVAHLGITADVQYKMGEFNELIIPAGVLKQKQGFDYIALGHYHENSEIAGNTYYAGSTEHFSFNEAGQTKGFMEIDLNKKEFKFIPIKAREMLMLEAINCENIGIEGIVNKIELMSKDNIKDKIIQITFDNISKHKYVELDLRRIKEITADAAYAKFVCNFAAEKGRKTTKTAIGALTAEFESFLEKQAVEDLNKEKLKELGVQYLSVIEESEES